VRAGFEAIATRRNRRTKALAKRSFVFHPNNHELDGNVPKELIVNANVFFGCSIVQNFASHQHRVRAVGEAKAFLRDDGGATMVEYAFMLMLIAIVCVAAISTIGSKLDTVYNTVADDF
jgi:pilus assembly protein Flp/PilA